MSDKEKTSLGLTETSGVLLMLNKDERLVIKELFMLTLQSESMKNYQGKNREVGPSLGLAENLLKNRGNSISFRYLAE